MKKFLSLLLAMTMVMSLIVLPARAKDVAGTIEGTPVVSKDGNTVTQFEMTTADTVTLISGRGNTQLKYGSNTVTGDDNIHAYYAWSVQAGSDVVSVSNAGVVTALKTGNATIRCTITMYGRISTQDEGEASATEKNVSAQAHTDISVTVSNPVFSAKDIAKVIYKGRESAVAQGATASVPYFTAGGETSTLNSSGWRAVFKSGSAFTYKDCSFDSSSNQLTVNANEDGTSPVVLRITAVETTPNFQVNSNAQNVNIAKNATINLTATNYNRSGVTPTYKWSYSYGDNKGGNIGTGATINKWKPTIVSGTTYPVAITVKCETYEGSPEVKTAEKTFTLTVNNNNYIVTTPAVGKLLANDTSTITLSPGTSFKFYLESDTKMAHIPGATYKYASSNSSVVAVGESNGVISAKGAGTANITITASYQGAEYTNTFAVTVVNPTYTLGSTYCGYNNSSYAPSTLVSYANSALSAAGITGVTVGSVALASASGNVVTAAGTAATGYTLTASPIYLGTADLTATVTKSTGGTFTMTFKVPVLPIPYSTSLGTVNAEPYTTGSTYYNNTYRVTLPTTFNQYYVVSKNTTPNYNVSAAPASGVTTVTLNQNEFVNGQCTLYVIAWNSNYNGYGYGYNYGTNYYGKYYSGAITVTQTNHDIKYNGVVGNTVQFKHNDFTTFMNEMYGTNTTSYLTFNSVKFTSVPNATTQGTLYYNGVAMTTGYGSNYFNTSTAVTNLDNVSFSVSSKVPSTTKEIRIPFTLYATRYNSYGTSAGTSVTYSGVVVISLVREDVTFTVAPGDSVRFTDSAFLTYLRSASGINYNYNIDYVTFDQSAVNALNEGVLYAYSTGFNAVKTTDRFYYTTTSYNQNALSDVTFRASTYAKTGTTVYIPFTITAKYGTSSATRQVTGTVAIKIAQTMNFVDVKPTDYFYDSVKWAVNDNITKGTSATTFSPNNTCTRAEIVTFLWRAAGSPTPTITRNPFTDVKYPVGSDFYNAILWASQNGITAGKTTTTFAPNDNCTRAQIVTFLWRYAKKPLGYYTNPFNDVNKTEYAAYYDAILWAAGKGIATGNTPKTFNPDGTCTRAEAVTFLYRYESTK